MVITGADGTVVVTVTHDAPGTATISASTEFVFFDSKEVSPQAEAQPVAYPEPRVETFTASATKEWIPPTAPASLGDYVWHDQNGDGIQDADESGIPNVTVKLLSPGIDNTCNTADDTQIATTVTSDGTTDVDGDGVVDPAGSYHFGNLTPGRYCVQFVPLAGYVFSPANQGTDDVKDSDADTATGKTGNIDLASGQHDPTNDAGLYLTPPTGCQVCEGKVTQMTLRYQGTSPVQVRVEQKKDGKVVFEGTVEPGESFTVYGQDKHGTLGTEVRIYVDGEFHVAIHTSCSQPIGPGMTFGDFYVVEAYSRKGGLICPVDTTARPSSDIIYGPGYLAGIQVIDWSKIGGDRHEAANGG